MYKLISFVVMISISFMPVAIAAEVPFYLRDRSQLPKRTSEAKNNLYIPSKAPYADWLVKRASEVSAKLSDCYKELDQYKDAKSERELSNKKWVLVKIEKKSSYLKFLNDKFQKVTGSTLADAGYDFSIQSTQEKPSLAEEKCAAPTGQKINEVSENNDLALPVEKASVVIQPAQTSEEVVNTKLTSEDMFHSQKTESKTSEDLAPITLQVSEPKVINDLPIQPIVNPSVELKNEIAKQDSTIPLSAPIKEEKTEKQPLSKPETTTPEIPVVLQLKDPEEEEKDNNENDNNKLPTPTHMALVEEKIQVRKDSDHVVDKKDLEKANVESVSNSTEPTNESPLTAPLDIVEQNRKDVIQKVEVKTVVVKSDESPEIKKTESTTTSMIIKDPENNTKTLVIVETPASEKPLTAPVPELQPEVKVDQVVSPTVKDSPALTKDEDIIPTAPIEPMKMEETKTETIVVKSTESPVVEKKTVTTEKTTTVETKSQQIDTIEVPVDSTQIETNSAPVVLKEKEAQTESQLMESLIAKKKKEEHSNEIKKEIPSTPPVVKMEPAPVEIKSMKADAPINDKIMEEGEIQQDAGPNR
jgi:hypothetical protein